MRASVCARHVRCDMHLNFLSTDAGTYLNDLHIFDTRLESWKELAPLGPIPPQRTESGFAALDGALYLFGGAQGHSNIYGKSIRVETYLNEGT